MSPGQRCDEILQLIDQVLGDLPAGDPRPESDATEAPAPADRWPLNASS